MTVRSPSHQADAQQSLLARLGLDERATNEDVADAHDELVSFLTSAPKSLRAWARTQAAAADEAFALLTDPDAPAVTEALSVPAGHPTVQPDGPATPPARRAPSLDAPTDVADVVGSPEATFEEMLAAVTPGTHRESLAPRGPAAHETSRPATGRNVDREPALPAHRSPLRRLVLVGVVLAAAVAIAVVGYQLGASPSTAAAPTGSAGPQASAGVDQALVADLMGKVQADPTDTDAMMRLGDAFYQGGDYGAAVTWFKKIVDAKPADVRARLALGAAYFNLGDMAGAETAWLAVSDADPTNVEAHYDLGFLYLNRTPADMDGVKREWSEVVRLAPDSDVAKTVKAHLDALSSPAPPAGASAAPSPAPSSAPSAVPSGAPSAAPSAAPSSSVQP